MFYQISFPTLQTAVILYRNLQQNVIFIFYLSLFISVLSGSILVILLFYNCQILLTSGKMNPAKKL